ncbi:MAG: hypothetical protein ABS79_03180 [Planctomycetes bacterium SCN 63-9]|nr:MAG: hypothetical protein ABS79_03180 [Planctomycetes bacterium SCN 63-9]
MASAAHAAFVPGDAVVDPGLTGTVETNVWSNDSITIQKNLGFPGFPGTGAWPSPIGSDSGGDATLNKTSNGNGGGPYPASGSIYFGGFSGDINNFDGTLQVSDATPVANLANVVFQVEIGEAWTYDFYNHVLPTLSYNGGNQAIAPTLALALAKFDNGTVVMPTGPETVYINTHLLQWDLSGIATPITSFSISFNGVQHAQLYDLRLDQSDVYTAYGASAAVPEPASLSLVGLGLSAILVLRKRRQ